MKVKVDNCFNCKLIVYEDESILVYYINSGSDRLFVSFSWRDFDWQSSDFFMRRPLEKLGFSALGIVAKGNNWFPRQSIEKVVYELSGMIYEYADITTCGSSMGAYAALKYVKAFKANRCLAFSPLWGVLEKECRENKIPFRKRWGEDVSNFVTHGGEGLSADNISNSTDYYLFSDFYDRVDNKHLDKIYSFAPNKFYTINVPFSGHPCIRAFKGTDIIKSILTSAFAKDVVSLRRIATKAISFSNRNRSQRSFEFYAKRYNNAVVKLSKRHPKFSYRLIFSSVVPISDKAFFETIVNLVSAKAVCEAIGLVKLDSSLSFEVRRNVFFNTLLNNSEKIIDCHGNYVCYDLIKEKVLANSEVSVSSMPVKCFYDNEYAILLVFTINGLKFISPCSELKLLSAVDVEDVCGVAFLSGTVDGKRFFSCKKGTLSVDRNKKVTLWPRKIKAYELFLLK